jgi:hypothetical protein
MEENTFEIPKCGRCKRAVTDVSYLEISANIVLQEFLPNIQVPIYRCPEAAENYAKRIAMHDDCWLDTLKDHGIKLHDITSILEKMKQKSKEKYSKPKQKKNKKA